MTSALFHEYCYRKTYGKKTEILYQKQSNNFFLRLTESTLHTTPMLRYHNKTSEVTDQKTSVFKKLSNDWHAAAHIM